MFSQGRTVVDNFEGLGYPFHETGKVHDANMKRFNAEAANLIFQAKQREVDPNELDLHGLYVNEAVEYTKDRFTADRAGGKKDLVRYEPLKPQPWN